MNVAFIPARGGSKSIPLKNIKRLAGYPLVYWVACAACQCRHIDRVYISTDSNDIKRTVEAFMSGNSIFDKLEVVPRSAESASDTASTEFAMLEFAASHEFDNIALVQATSPMLSSADLDKGFELLDAKETDSVMSVVHQYRFNWSYDESGNIHPMNYDVFHRPRRQEFDGYLVENGAFYITSKKNLLSSKNRVSGNIRAVEMHPDSFLEIDEVEDWVIIESLMQRRLDEGKKQRTFTDVGATQKGKIKMLLTDVDGCLTDGGMYYSENGDELKKFNARDGMAFKMLQDHGVITGIITSESVELNKRRARKLNLDVVITGCKDKAEAIRTLSEEKNIALENICYIGDDVNDGEALGIVGLSCVPADADVGVYQMADIVTDAPGGKGVIREVVNRLLFDRQKIL